MREPPPVAPAPCLMNGSVTFGSFNALAKITDEVIEVCFIVELT
jgi:protein O-GlcNAc transferase